MSFGACRSTECSAGRLEVTASNAIMCETNISVWAAFEIVGQMWKSSYPGIERCHIHLGQQTQDLMWLLPCPGAQWVLKVGCPAPGMAVEVHVDSRAASAVVVMR